MRKSVRQQYLVVVGELSLAVDYSLRLLLNFKNDEHLALFADYFLHSDLENFIWFFGHYLLGKFLTINQVKGFRRNFIFEKILSFFVLFLFFLIETNVVKFSTKGRFIWLKVSDDFKKRLIDVAVVLVEYFAVERSSLAIFT